MTRYMRHVIADKLPIEAMSLAIDADKAALRYLVPAENFGNLPLMKEGGASLLKTTQKLASPFLGTRDEYYLIEDKKYAILAEAILDRNSKLYSRCWVPGAHFIFQFDPARGFFIDCKGGLTYFDLRNTADYIRYKGGVFLFELWVRRLNQPVDECARSICTAPDTKLVTNLDGLGEEWSAAEVMQGGASKWLNLGYELTCDKQSVEPEGWANFTFKVLDGKTGELATDVTYDGYIVEAVDGYVPHRRLPVVDGVGTFRAWALGLTDGERMRIKVNRRFFSGLAECTVPVENA